MKSNTSPSRSEGSHRPGIAGAAVHRHFMLGCYAIAATGFGLVVLSGWQGQSGLGGIALTLPFLLCAGLHLAMHRVLARAGLHRPRPASAETGKIAMPEGKHEDFRHV